MVVSAETPTALAGLPCQRGVTPRTPPVADKTRLPSVGAAAPIRTTFRRSCPLGLQPSAVMHYHASHHCCHAAKSMRCSNFRPSYPVKVFRRLVGVYNRGQHIVYDGFCSRCTPNLQEHLPPARYIRSSRIHNRKHAPSAVQPHYPYPTAHIRCR